MPKKEMQRKNPKESDTLCSHPSCNEMINKNDQAMCCDSCLKWHHLGCTDLDLTIYNILVDTPAKGIKWFCDQCNPKFHEISELKTTVQTQEKYLKTISESIEALKDSHTAKFKELECMIKKDKEQNADLNEKVQTFADVLNKNTKKTSETNNAITSINKNLNCVKTNIESKIEEEGEEKAKSIKVNNICIFNVPESNSDDADTRDRKDVVKLKKLFQDKLQLKQEDIKFIKRVSVNRKNSDNDRPRPIIMKFSKIEKRNEALKLGMQKLEDAGQEHNIFIHPDRTKREQEKHKLLVKELFELRDQGKKVKIINNKIIEVELPFRRNPQLFWGE